MAGTDLKSREAAWQAAMDESKILTFRKVADPTGKLTPPAVVHSPDAELYERGGAPSYRGSI